MSAADYESRLPALLPKLRAAIAARVDDPATVDALLQDTVAQGYRRLAQLRDPAKLTAWLKAIARNLTASHFRRQKDRQLQAMAEATEAASPEERDSLFEAFDEMIRKMAALGVSQANLRICALHFCLQWTPREIAAITGNTPQTIYNRLSRARRELRQRRGAKPLSRVEDIRLKTAIATDLWWAGGMPVAGDGSRNRLLMEQAYALACMICLQYPDEPYVQGLRMSLGYGLARFSGTENLHEIITMERFGHWNRAAWNPRWLQDAEDAYQSALRLNLDPAQRCYLEAEHAIFSPARNEEVDWTRVRSLLEENTRLWPNSRNHIALALAMSVIDGPAAAARHLESFRGNESLRDNPIYYVHLAKLHYQARHGDKAARYFRKFLGWVRNREWRTVIHRVINDCKTRQK